MIKNYSIIFFPLVDWEDPWQRYQHLALYFSKFNRVFYLNYPVAITYLMRNPVVLLKKWFRFFVGKRKIHANLTVGYPPPCLPFERSSWWINLLNQYVLFWYIKTFVKPGERLILWINDPYKYLMIKLLSPEIAVYDCPDAIVFKDSSRKQRLYDQFKKRVLQESTVSLFTSKSLLDDGGRYAKNYYYVPNGVDVKSFMEQRRRTPEIVKDIPGIILGVVGTLDERVDIELLEFIVENIEEAILLLVGPIQTNIGKLAKHPRVLVVGKSQYEEIPSFIKRFDVALIPYRINEITKAVYPVKLHEYLILGKPVVATDLPELEQFSKVIWIANTKEEFVRSIRLALNEKDSEIRQERIKIAKENSWEQRTSQITDILQKYL